MNPKLKALYNDICNGYSKIRFSSHQFYVKHPTYSEFFSHYDQHDKFLSTARKLGIKTFEESLKFIIDSGWWSEENEKRIKSFREYIKNRELTLKALNSNHSNNGATIKTIEKDINKSRAIIESYLFERRSLMGVTAEEWAIQKINNLAVLDFFYVDKDLSEKIDSELPDELFEQLNLQYQNFLIRFDEENIKMLAATSFFRTLISLMGDDVSGFFGTNVSRLTKSQSDLLTYGKAYQNKIRNYYTDPKNKNPIPDEILTEPALFIKWSEGKNEVVNAEPGQGVAMFQRPKENEVNRNSVLKLAMERGGEFNFNQFPKEM